MCCLKFVLDLMTVKTPLVVCQFSHIISTCPTCVLIRCAAWRIFHSLCLIFLNKTVFEFLIYPGVLTVNSHPTNSNESLARSWDVTKWSPKVVRTLPWSPGCFCLDPILSQGHHLVVRKIFSRLGHIEKAVSSDYIKCCC